MIQKELTGDLKLKWDRIQQAMRKINADGCLLTVDVNLYYTTGRIYSGYFYLPAEGAPWFFVKRPNLGPGAELFWPVEDHRQLCQRARGPRLSPGGGGADPGAGRERNQGYGVEGQHQLSGGSGF